MKRLPNILTKSIHLFADPPAPPAGGDGDNPPPPDGGGGGDGGGTGGDDPDLTPEAKAAIAEIADFKEPSLDFLDGDPNEKKEGEKPPVDDAAAKAAAEKKAAEDKAAADKKAADEKAAAEKKSGKPGGEPPIEQLRKDHAAQKARIAELEPQAARVKELEAQLVELQELKKQRDELTGERDKFKTELQIRDPLARGDIEDLSKAHNEEMAPYFEDMPDLAKNGFSAFAKFLEDFAALPAEPEKRSGPLADLKKAMGELVGDENVPRALEAMRKQMAYHKKRDGLEKSLRTDSERLAYERGEKNWQTKDKQVLDYITHALDLPEGIETSDPFNPVLGMSRFLESMDAGKKKALLDKIDAFVRRTNTGAKPRSDKEFPGLEPDQIREKIAAEHKWHDDARPISIQSQKQGLLALALWRPLLAELAKYRDAEKKRTDATPPDPNAGGGGGGNGGGDADAETVVKEAQTGLSKL